MFFKESFASFKTFIISSTTVLNSNDFEFEKCIISLPYVSVFKLPTSFGSESGIFPPLFCYCVKSPCTNPTVLLLSSGPWKWTESKTCRVHVNQIRTETPPQTLLPYSNSYL